MPRRPATRLTIESPFEEKDGVRSKAGKAGFDFTKRLPGIEGDAHGGTGDGDDRQSGLRAVRHGDRDPRTSAQSCRAQRGAEVAKQNLQIAVGEGSKAGRNDRGLIRLRLGAQLDCGAERGRFRRSYSGGLENRLAFTSLKRLMIYLNPRGPAVCRDPLT